MRRSSRRDSRRRSGPSAPGIGSGPVTTISGGVGAGTAGGLVAFDASAPGLVVDGATSGTVAFIVGPTDRVVPDVTKLNQVYGTTLPDEAGIQAVRSDAVAVGTEVISTADVRGNPIRILTTSVERPEGEFVVQVIGDRADEVRTLTVLLTVLVAGGLLVLVASLAVGWVYADRALVPIRDALRRQREFAADASHELRTPLAIIRGSVEELRREPDRNAPAGTAALDGIDDEVVRLGSLVDDLLLLARTDSGTLDLSLAPTDLGEIALDASTGLATIATDRDIRIEVDAEPVPLTADADRLRQLVRILGDNAVRHAPAGSTVEIAVHTRDGSRRPRRRGPRPGLPRGGSAARLRAFLASAGRAGRRHRSRADDRRLDRRTAWRHDRGGQSSRRRRPDRGHPADPLRPIVVSVALHRRSLELGHHQPDSKECQR